MLVKEVFYPLLDLHYPEVSRFYHLACIATRYILLSTVLATIVAELLQNEVHQYLETTGTYECARVFDSNGF